MKGIYLINSLEGGGAERVFSTLVNVQCDSSDFNEFIVVLLDSKEKAYHLSAAADVVEFSSSKSKLKGLVDYFALIKKEKPDYVVSFLTRSNAFNILGSLFYGYQSIISERSNTDGRLNKSFFMIKRFLIKNLYRHADKVIAVSGGVKQCLISNYAVNPKKVSVINNPVDKLRIDTVAKEEKIDKQKPYVIAMGRLVESKCFDVLLNAYAKANIPESLKILGQGPELSNLQQQVKNLGLEDKVEFLGFQKNPYAYIKAAAFFVLPSRLEGFPNALVEAMSLKKAVISTNCTDGPSEILDLRQDIAATEYVVTSYGIVINVGDASAMSKSMLALSNDVALREGLEVGAYSRVDQYSPQKFQECVVEIIRESALLKNDKSK